MLLSFQALSALLRADTFKRPRSNYLRIRLQKALSALPYVIPARAPSPIRQRAPTRPMLDAWNPRGRESSCSRFSSPSNSFSFSSSSVETMALEQLGAWQASPTSLRTLVNTLVHTVLRPFVVACPAPQGRQQTVEYILHGDGCMIQSMRNLTLCVLSATRRVLSAEL